MATSGLVKLITASRVSTPLTNVFRPAWDPTLVATLPNRNQARHQVTVAKQQVKPVQQVHPRDEGKPFKQIPRISFFRFAYDSYKDPELRKSHVWVKIGHEQLGDIFCIKVPFGLGYVIVRKPEDIKALLAADGKHPVEPIFDLFVLYRGTYRKDLYPSVTGLIGSHGEAWYEFRSAVQQDMMRPKSAMFYLDEIADISSSLVDLLAHKMEPNDKDGFIGDVTPFLHRWALESIGAIFLDYRIGALEPNLSQDSEADRMISCANVLLGEDHEQLIQSIPFYRLYATKPYKNFDNASTELYQISKRIIQKAMDNLQQKVASQKDDLNKDQMSVLQKLLKRCGPDSDIPLVMAMDALMAGIDTTGNSGSFLLYQLASNPDKQEKLYQEIEKVIGTDPSKKITEANMGQLKYLKAAIQESIRLMPVAGGLMRKTQKDLVLAGYQIPAGTFVAVSNSVNMRSEAYFDRPEEFIPERWLRQIGSGKGSECPGKKEARGPSDPYGYLPFGHGPRMCIGKRFAVMEIQLLAIRLLQRYRLVYEEKTPLDMITPFVHRPDRPVRIRFIKR